MKIKVHETLTKTSLTIIAIYLLSLSTLTITYIKDRSSRSSQICKITVAKFRCNFQTSYVLCKFKCKNTPKQVMSCASPSVTPKQCILR